jgi:hypothetical protein
MVRYATYRWEKKNYVVKFEMLGPVLCRIISVVQSDNLVVCGQIIPLLPSCELVKSDTGLLRFKIGTQGAADCGHIEAANLLEILVVQPPA